MKPPNMSGLLKFFDCSGIDPVTTQSHLGWTTDTRTGQPIDLGFAEGVDLVGPYAHVPCPGDNPRELQRYGNRLRDARYIWTRTVLTPGVDGDAGYPGTRVTRTETGEVYLVVEQLEHSKVAGFQGYLMLREQT